jgi:hypothetical protein
MLCCWSCSFEWIKAAIRYTYSYFVTIHSYQRIKFFGPERAIIRPCTKTHKRGKKLMLTFPFLTKKKGSENVNVNIYIFYFFLIFLFKVCGWLSGAGIRISFCNCVFFTQCYNCLVAVFISCHQTQWDSLRHS